MWCELNPRKQLHCTNFDLYLYRLHLQGAASTRIIANVWVQPGAQGATTVTLIPATGGGVPDPSAPAADPQLPPRHHLGHRGGSRRLLGVAAPQPAEDDDALVTGSDADDNNIATYTDEDVGGSAEPNDGDVSEDELAAAKREKDDDESDGDNDDETDNEVPSVHAHVQA